MIRFYFHTHSLHQIANGHSVHNVSLFNIVLYEFEPRHKKTGFLHMRKQRRRSVTAQLISAFVCATQILLSLFFLDPKFQASSHLLWLYSPVCVGPGRKPRRPVFSQRGSFHYHRLIQPSASSRIERNQRISSYDSSSH